MPPTPAPQTDRPTLWHAAPGEPSPPSDPLPSAAVDVAIVGAGYTGLSTALHCAEAGLRVHVIEAMDVGYGGSGRNVGLVNAGVWHPPDAVQAALGPVYGPRFLETFGAAPAAVFALIERHQIRCAPRRDGTIHAAHAPRAMAGLQARHAAWARLEAPVELLSQADTARLTGSPAFFGGLLDRRAGTVQPLAYVRGLARAARGAGCGLTTGLSANALVSDGAGWRIDTASGPLHARQVVLGTNAYTDTLWPGLSRCVTHIDYFQLATEPLGDRARGLLSHGHGVWDTGAIMRSIRRDPTDRLVLGSMGRVIGRTQRGITARWGARQLARIFPQLGPVRFSDAWHGRIAMTPDHLPRIVQLADGLYTPIGYNGRGITTGTVFGAAMATLLSGGDAGDLPLPITKMETLRAPRWTSRAYAGVFAAAQVWRGL